MRYSEKVTILIIVDSLVLLHCDNIAILPNAIPMSIFINRTHIYVTMYSAVFKHESFGKAAEIIFLV